ncbi:sigma factor-like helix-turn-helix DNA-binding protein [Streptomyces mayteni]
MLESPSPAERAVFVLHDVFGHPHADIAEMLGRRTDSVRQLARRARQHVRARRPRYRVDPRVRRQATERFLAATLGGDVKESLRVLAPDVTLWTDGGGKGPAGSTATRRRCCSAARAVRRAGPRRDAGRRAGDRRLLGHQPGQAVARHGVMTGRTPPAAARAR